MSMQLTFEVMTSEFSQTQPIVLLSEFSVGPPASFDNLNAAISNDPGNSLQMGEDNKLYVPDPTDPDPLPYYILAKG